MTIGFFDTEMDALVNFKNSIDAFPSHNWCIYINIPEPSWGERTEPDMHDTTSGLAWLLGKETDVILLGKNISKVNVQTVLDGLHKGDVQLFTSYEELSSFLETAPESPEVPGAAKLRDIHLTKHSEEQDALMAETLGGFLIND